MSHHSLTISSTMSSLLMTNNVPLSCRPASTSSSTSSSLAGSSHWLPEARTRRSSESASTSSSCPSASSCRRKTKAPVRSHRHRCVQNSCPHILWSPPYICSCRYLRTTLCFLSADTAVVMAGKLSVIECHAATGPGVGIEVSVAAFPFPLGGLHSRAAAFTDLHKPTETNKLNTPNIILITRQEQMLVWSLL